MVLLLKNGEVVTAETIMRKDILINGEKIERIDDNISVDEISIENSDDSSDIEVLDVEGKYILPGIIDAHTHYLLKSRNSVTADDFYSGSKSAAFGGVTTYVDFADQLDGCSLPEAINNRKNEAEDKTVIDYTLHQSVYNFDSNVEEDFSKLREIGINNIKIFTTYEEEGYLIDTDRWEDLFKAARENNLLITVHAEDDEVIKEIHSNYESREHFPPHYHPILRPAESEYQAVKKVGSLASSLDMPIYIVHLSSQKGCKAVEEIKDMGGRIYAETTPHYLTLTNELLEKDNAQKYLMTPPLREKKDNEALLNGLSNGLIDTVATDHCSFNVEQKMRSDNCLDILPGIPGSETLLPLVHEKGVNNDYIDINKMVDLLSTKPAKIFGLYPQKGSIKEGTDADLVVFDPEKEINISDSQQHSEAKYTPYSGIKVKGYPVTTIFRGDVIVNDDKFYGKKGNGSFLKAKKSLLY